MLSGKMLKAGILSAAQRMELHSDEVDALNVFPVPDGDTGTNMTMTVSAAARELALVPDECGFDEAAERVASAMLRGARGNSGVILSLIFRGIAKSVKGQRVVSGTELAQALAHGSETAYKAVMKPTEGTILTVARVAAEEAAATDVTALEGEKNVAGAVAVWNAALRGAREALAQTPSMLPVLRKAGVVDAGGQGLVYVMEGLLQGFMGIEDDLPAIAGKSPGKWNPNTQNGQEILYAYCTEFLVERAPAAPRADPEALRQALLELGDCVAVIGDDEVIKGHVHSNSPGVVLTLAQGYGDLLEVKIENMRVQRRDAQAVASGYKQFDLPDTADGGETPEDDAIIEKRYGIVAVASGEGIVNLLREIGVDQVVTGGQSMNPSAEDLLQAVNRCRAEHVFILPNNKNIILAAEQVAPLTGRGVSVVHTRSVAQGVGAVLAFEGDAEPEANRERMQCAAGRVQTAMVTFAARDSNLENMVIRKGSVIGLENDKITQTGDDPVKVAEKVARHLVRRHNGSTVTVYSGDGITEEQTGQLMQALEKRYEGSVELAAVPGGQPLYYFMIAVE